MHAKKSLGQNFLINSEALKQIAETLDTQDGEVVIEIGPGHGELTSLLTASDNKRRIIAIEKDTTLVPFLHKKFQETDNVEIIEGDALRLLPKLTGATKLQSAEYKLVGNIPYYITGHLLRIISELPHKPVLTVLTVQKEVAERIVAAPPKMNILSASIAIWADAKIISFIDKKSFSPSPKVDSAVIKLKTKNTTVNLPVYYTLVRTVFKNPRKTLWNNIRNTEFEHLKTKLKDLCIKKNARAESLSLNDLLELTKYLEKTP